MGILHQALRHFYLRKGGYVIVVVCLSVCLVATLCKKFRTDWHEIFSEGWQWTSEQTSKFWWRSGSPSGYRDCFPDTSLMEIRKVVSTNCAARRFSARHALAGIAIATMTSLRNRPTTQPRQTCFGGGMHCPSASTDVI